MAIKRRLWGRVRIRVVTYESELCVCVSVSLQFQKQLDLASAAVTGLCESLLLRCLQSACVWMTHTHTEETWLLPQSACLAAWKGRVPIKQLGPSSEILVQVSSYLKGKVQRSGSSAIARLLAWSGNCAEKGYAGNMREECHYISVSVSLPL